MKPSVKVRKSGNEKSPWVNFIDLQVGGVEISYAPAYFKTHEAAVKAASIRAEQLNQLITDQEEHA